MTAATLKAAAAGALCLSLAACAPGAEAPTVAPAVAANGVEQQRAQVQRELIQLGIDVPGGVETLTDDQVLALATELDVDRRDPARMQRVRQIIEGG